MALSGAEAHLRRLKALPRRTRREASKLVYNLADQHVERAAFLITEGAVSGANHVPSLPYEPPNADTHALDRSGHVRARGPLKAESVFDIDYAVALEFGTERVIERPFARPAAKDVRRKVDDLAERGVRVIVRGGSL